MSRKIYKTHSCRNVPTEIYTRRPSGLTPREICMLHQTAGRDAPTQNIQDTAAGTHHQDIYKTSIWVDPTWNLYVASDGRQGCPNPKYARHSCRNAPPRYIQDVNRGWPHVKSVCCIWRPAGTPPPKSVGTSPAVDWMGPTRRIQVYIYIYIYIYRLNIAIVN